MPTSALHRQGSLDKLKKGVEEVNTLIKDALNITQVMQQFVWDMEIGYKGIVRIAPPLLTAKMLKKPSLNTEDIWV